MSTLSGVSSKGEKGKSKFQSLDINSIYHKTNKGESSEQQQAKSTVPRKHGMQSLGKVPSTRRAPVNLPSLKSEHSGSDPSVSLVPTGGTGWGSKTSDLPPITSTSPVTTSGPTQVTNAPAAVGTAPVQQTSITPTQPTPQQPPKPTPVVSTSGDKTWSSVAVGGVSGEGVGPPNAGSGPSFLAHQSPQFQAEFPSLPGEGGVPGPPRPPDSYGPGPSLRPQTEGSWLHGGGFQPPPPPTTTRPPFPPALPTVPSPTSIVPQYKGVVPTFLLNHSGSGGFPGMFPGNFQNSLRPKFHSGTDNRYSSGSRPPPLSDPDDLIARPIIREEDLNRMDEISRDSGWATQDDIDYNQKLAFSDDEGQGNDDDKDIKNKTVSNQNREEKKDNEIEKENRDKIPDKYPDKSHQGWQGRSQSIHQPEFRSPLTKLPQSNAGREMDMDDVWKEKRRQQFEQVAAVTEKAKQRKEEEEKRFEETRSKSESEKKKKEESDLEPENEKKDQGETFRQLTQLDSRNFSRGDSQPNYNRFHTPLAPRFQKQQFSLRQQQGTGSETRWGSQHYSSGKQRLRGDSDEGKEKDDEGGRRDRNTPEPSDRFRSGSNRPERDYELNKKNTSYDKKSDSHRNFQHDFKDNKEIRDRDSEMEWEGRRGGSSAWEGPRSSEESNKPSTRRDIKKTNDTFNKAHSVFDEHDGEWRENRDRPVRPDSRDSRASRDIRVSREESRNITESVNSDYSWAEPDYVKDVHEEKPRRKDTYKDDRRDTQSHSRREGHVPGPITREKMEAYEHKQIMAEVFKAEKKELMNSSSTENKVDDDLWKQNDTSNNSNWAESPDERQQLDQKHILTQSHQSSQLSSIIQASQKVVLVQANVTETPSPLTGTNVNEETTAEKVSKDDGPLGEKKNQGSGPVGLKEKEKGLGRGSGRSGRGNNRHNYNSPNFNVFYRGSSSSNWSSNKESVPRRGPPKQGKPWNISESEGSGDEISASTESGKEDKKIERKQAPRSPKAGGERKKDKDDRNKDSKKNESTIKASDNNNPGRKPPSVTQSGGQGGGFSSSGGFEGGRKEGFLPRGEPSRRGRGGGAFRAPGGRGPAPAHYGPPGSKPAFPAPSASSKDDEPNDSSSEEKKKPVITGRKEQRKSDSDSSRSNKGKGGKVKREHDDWETTSEGSDSETKGKPRQNKKLLHSRSSGEKRNVFSSGQVNGRPRSEEGKQTSEKTRGSKDDEDPSSRFINHSDIFPSNNGFQEVRSKKTGKEGRPLGKDELKRSRGKEKGNKGPPGVSKPGTQGKSYPREWNNKPPRMQRQLMLQQQQQQQLQAQPADSVSDMNKLNQNISMFPLRDVSCPAPAPPPSVNAWDKPITAALRTSSPPANLHHLAPSIPNPQEKNVIEINDHGPSGGSSQTSSPSAEKALSKIGRETVEKSFLDGATPPVQTIVFENTNLKAPSDALKSKYPLKTQRIEKGRDRKLEEELDENSHIGLGSFKSGTEIKANETKAQETIQMPLSFSKSEDTADMKLDFHFESDLSHLTEDKPNIPRSIHQVLVQSSAADLNQKIASVKKVWETPPGSMSMMEHQHHDEVVSTSSSSFTPNFGSTVDSTLDHSHQITTDDSTFPSDVYTTQNSSSNRQNYFIISGPQIQGSTQGYTNTGNNIIKADPTNPNSNVCKVKPQPQQAVISSTIGTHSGQSLSSPPPFNQQGHYGFQTPYNSMPAIPSPPAVIINSGPAAGAQQVPPNHQADLYHSFPINGPTMISSGAARSGFSQYPYGLGQGLGSTSGYSQGNLYLPQPTAPPASEVFQSLSQFRLQPSAAPAYGQSQQINSNPSTVLMTSSSNSLMSASVKSSVQPPPLGAIGSKAGFQSSAHPSQVQLSYISYDPTSMLPQNYLQSSQIVQRHGGNNVVPAIQPTTSYYSSSTGGQTGLFPHGSSILAGAAGSQPAALHNATAFGMQGFGAQSATAPAQPTSSNPVGVQSYSSQMGQFRAQAAGAGGSPYLKTSTNPPSQQCDPSKSPSTNQDLVNSVFSGGGGGGQIPSPKSRAGGGKQSQPPQQPSPTQPHHPKFTPYQTQQNLVMQQGNGGRGPPIGQQGMRSGSNNGNGLSNNGVNRYPAPIQRPVVAYQGIQQGGRHRGPLRPQLSHHLKMPATPQYYSHQGGSVKLDGEGKEGEGKLAEGKGEKKEEQSGGSEQ